MLERQSNHGRKKKNIIPTYDKFTVNQLHYLSGYLRYVRNTPTILVVVLTGNTNQLLHRNLSNYPQYLRVEFNTNAPGTFCIIANANNKPANQCKEVEALRTNFYEAILLPSESLYIGAIGFVVNINVKLWVEDLREDYI